MKNNPSNAALMAMLVRQNDRISGLSRKIHDLNTKLLRKYHLDTQPRREAGIRSRLNELTNWMVQHKFAHAKKLKRFISVVGAVSRLQEMQPNKLLKAFTRLKTIMTGLKVTKNHKPYLVNNAERRELNTFLFYRMNEQKKRIADRKASQNKVNKVQK